MCPLLLGPLAALAASLAPSEDSVPRSGEWRGVLASPGGDLPFGLVLHRGPEGWSAELVNGPERGFVGRVTVAGGVLEVRLDPYDSRLLARVEADGARLAGAWVRERGGGRTTTLPFRATHGAAPRFGPREAPDDATSAAIEGRWAVDFSADEHPAVGVFRVLADGRAHGTFLTTLGDYRYLAGDVDGRTLRLSVFDGAHAFLFRATLREDGTLAGDFWSRDTWHETWTGRRDPDAALPDAFALTEWTGAVPLGSLRFPDVDGDVRALDDPAFDGRARLLVLFGTWCPNCNDLTDYLVELDARYRARGLSILGLAFEFGEDAAEQRAAVRRYAAHHGARYPILVAGTSDKAAASEAFPLLDRVRAYPTTVFLDGDGDVKAVYTGFSGPATGPAHRELRARFEAEIEALLGGNGGREDGSDGR